MTPRPIFKDTRQALRFAYMIEHLPAREGGSLGRQLERMQIEETGIIPARDESSISFAGLSDQEIRGQCSLIRASVEHHLPGPENWSVRSKWGATEIERGPDRAIIRACFTRDRIEAMTRMAEYAEASLAQSRTTCLWLIARVCAESDEVRPTLRQIEEASGCPKSTAERAEKRIKRMLSTFTNLAVDRLTPLFLRDGLVPQD